MKKIISILILLLSIMLVVSCGGEKDGAGTNGGNSSTHRVRLVVPEGVTVTSANPVTVENGGTARFTVSMGKTMAYRSVSEGSYDAERKMVVITNITKDTSVDFFAKDVGYDTTVSYKYFFVGSSDDYSSQKTSDAVYAGTEIKLYAGKTYEVFGGWSIGGYLENGGRLLSAEREFSFDLSPDLAVNGKVAIYVNYVDANIIYYDANGGNINTDRENAKGSKYYTAELEANGERLKISLDADYYNQVGCAALFWDDGSFSRDGYVLVEYNTKPDGTGEGYSLGSKFPMNGEERTLYCIWEKDTAHTDFTYEKINQPMPSSTNLAKAPHWKTEGIIITSYNGNDKKVVIPEKIDGMYVTAIAEGAFKNKSLEILVLSKYILTVEDSAFVGCSNLTRIYYPDSIYNIGNAALDNSSYKNLHEFYVNATMAPRFQGGDGGFWLKFARFISNSHKPRIAVIAGSSAFQGLSTEYLEALLDGGFCVVNFGTTRTTHGYMYLEAMQYYANENDIILYAPENSIYMLGEPRLYWKTLRDLEGMYNIFRHVDIAGYENIFGAFAEVNRGSEAGAVNDILQSGRYTYNPTSYESAITRSSMNEYGEYQYPERRGKYCNDSVYQDVYNITFNERVKSILEGNYMDSDPNEDYNTSEKWCSFTDEKYVKNMNRAINAAKSSGAKVYFSFCPIDASKICLEARADLKNWLKNYDKLIEDTYDFDGNLGSSANYVYNHKYFYDNAFHPNDYGRVYRTYTVYTDLCAILGLSPKDLRGVGTEFEGCLFEAGYSNSPIYGVELLK